MTEKITELNKQSNSNLCGIDIQSICTFGNGGGLLDYEVASSRHNFGRNGNGPNVACVPGSQYAPSVGGDDNYSFAASHHHHNIRDQRDNGNDQSSVDINT